MLEKIDKSLHKVCAENATLDGRINVIIYAHNLDKLYDILSEKYDDIYSYNFISALGLKIKNSELIPLAKLNIVKYITSVSMVSNNIHIAKNI